MHLFRICANGDLYVQCNCQRLYKTDHSSQKSGVEIPQTAGHIYSQAEHSAAAGTQSLGYSLQTSQLPAQFQSPYPSGPQTATNYGYYQQSQPGFNLPQTAAMSYGSYATGYPAPDNISTSHGNHPTGYPVPYNTATSYGNYLPGYPVPDNTASQLENNYYTFEQYLESIPKDMKQQSDRHTLVQNLDTTNWEPYTPGKKGQPVWNCQNGRWEGYRQGKAGHPTWHDHTKVWEPYVPLAEDSQDAYTDPTGYNVTRTTEQPTGAEGALENRRIFIAGIHPDTDKRQLKDFLKKMMCGPIECELHKDRKTKKLKGTATADYHNEEQASNAIRTLHRTRFNDRTLMVRHDKQKLPSLKPSEDPAAPVIVDGSKPRKPTQGYQ